ncbi:anaphase-promoting complex subunit Hcn1 [Lobulomyces angularis]|nr:anaphase-promoting complex subunit Hcn1 [Lobulomyces angularis]
MPNPALYANNERLLNNKSRNSLGALSKGQAPVLPLHTKVIIQEKLIEIHTRIHHQTNYVEHLMQKMEKLKEGLIQKEIETINRMIKKNIIVDAANLPSTSGNNSYCSLENAHVAEDNLFSVGSNIINSKIYDDKEDCHSQSDAKENIEEKVKETVNNRTDSKNLDIKENATCSLIFNPKRNLKFASIIKVTWDFLFSVFLIYLLILVPVVAGFEKATNFEAYKISESMTIAFTLNLLIKIFTYNNRKVEADSSTEPYLDTSLKEQKEPHCLKNHESKGKNKFLWLFLGKIISFLTLYEIFIIFPWKKIFSEYHIVDMEENDCRTLLSLQFIGDYAVWKYIPTERDVWGQYTWSFWASIANTFPISPTPRAIDESDQWLQVILCIGGMLMFGLVIGGISEASMNEKGPIYQYNEKITQIKEYIKIHRLPEDLSSKVEKYFEFKYKKIFFDEMTIVNNLNPTLKNLVTMASKEQLIKKIPFLVRNTGDGFDKVFMYCIAESLEDVIFIPDEIIFQEGDPVADCMYFIVDGNYDETRVLLNFIVGNLEVIRDNKAVTSLGEGDFFGEIALLFGTPRNATVVAREHCHLYKLGYDDFALIIKAFPDILSVIEKTCEERKKFYCSNS